VVNRESTFVKKIMKSLTLILILLTPLAVTGQGRLEVTVVNVKDTTGTVRVGIFKDESTFLKEAFVGKVVKASKGEVKVIFERVPLGKYALSVIHDENRNGMLDSNVIGIPKEGFGFSNDAMGMFGPPDFEKCVFVITDMPPKMTVTMRYM
jgi:uncharacterized protein (DUF2141 family)